MPFYRGNRGSIGAIRGLGLLLSCTLGLRVNGIEGFRVWGGK